MTNYNNFLLCHLADIFLQVTRERKSKANPADDGGDDELLFHESRFDDCRC